MNFFRKLSVTGWYVFATGFALALFAVLWFTPIVAKAADALEPVFRVLKVHPSRGAQDTNAFEVVAKDGTNFFAVDPTNARVRLMLTGALHQAVLATNLNLETSTNFTLIFRNGILVGVE